MADGIARKIGSAPAALWAHVLLVTAAVVSTLPRPWDGGAWGLLALMPLILAFLLAGSRFAWWVQLIGSAGALKGLYDAHRRVNVSDVDLSVFFDPETAVVTAALVVLGAMALLLPSTRRHVDWSDSGSSGLRGRGAFLIAALMVATAPSYVLGAESRIPSEGTLEEVEGGVFLGGDDAAEVAFYETRDGDLTCVHAIRRSGSQTRCKRAG